MLEWLREQLSQRLVLSVPDYEDWGWYSLTEYGGAKYLVGASGDAVGPQLHFEVRKLNQAVDPFRYLAPRTQARAAPGG